MESRGQAIWTNPSKELLRELAKENHLLWENLGDQNCLEGYLLVPTRLLYSLISQPRVSSGTLAVRGLRR